MALINLPDGKSIDISEDGISVYFGDVRMCEYTPEQLVADLRTIDKLEDEPWIYNYKIKKGEKDENYYRNNSEMQRK